MSGGIRAAVLASVLLLLSCGVAAADINVNTTGWWRDGDAFNASGTPIQAAHDGATAETINVQAGTYTEGTVTITKSNLVFNGSGKATTIINPPQYYKAFDIVTDGGTINYGIIEGFTIGDGDNEGIAVSSWSNSLNHFIIRDNFLSDFEVSGSDNLCNNLTLTNNIIGNYTWGQLQSVQMGLSNSYFSNNIWYTLTFIADSKNNTFNNETFSRDDTNNMALYLTGSGSDDNFTFTDTNIVNCGGTGYYGISISDTNMAFTDTTFDSPYKSIELSSVGTANFIQNDNRVFVGTAGYTIANATASNLTVADGTYEYRPFWITPSTGELNITSTPTWDTSGDYKKQFNITGTSGTFWYRIGDMLPNTDAKISTDSWSDTKTANGDGEITGTYNGGWSTQNFTVLSITPPPTNIQHTTGNFWVNHTWQPGTGTDGYNISVNSGWHNSTAASYNDSYLAHAWQNITVWAWNSSMGMSLSNITQDTQIPNNAIAITDTADWIGDPNQTVTVNHNSTDADSDTPTYSCSRTDLFTDFDTANGTGNWTPATKGTYYVDFGVSDGYGSTANYTMTIQVGVSGITTETKVPVSLFAVLMVLMLCGVFYVFYAKTHISRIFTTLIVAWMAFMLSQMIVSGNVVQTVSALNSADVWSHDTVAIQIPGLSYLLLFIGVILSIFLVKFVIDFGLAVLKEARREGM